MTRLEVAGLAVMAVVFTFWAVFLWKLLAGHDRAVWCWQTPQPEVCVNHSIVRGGQG